MSGGEEPRRLTLEDISGIEIRQLDGVLYSSDRPRRLRADVNLQVSWPDDLSSVHVSAEVSAVGLKPGEDGGEGEDLGPVFEAVVGYHVPLKETLEAPGDNLAVITLLWPYARSELVGHAGRLGWPWLRLPVDVAQFALQLVPDEEQEAITSGD